MDFYQVFFFFQIMPLGSKLAPPRGSQVWAQEQRKSSPLQTWRRRALIFGMWHLQWTSTKFVQMMPLGWKLAPPRGSQVGHRNKERKFYNTSSLKQDGLELWYFVCSSSLWTSTKFVNKMPLGSKLAPPCGSQVEHRNKERKFSPLKLDDIELW